MAAKALKEAGTAVAEAAINRKNNLLDIAYGYKDWGLGLKVTRDVWGPEHHSYWTITRVVPTLNVSVVIGLECLFFVCCW